MRLWKIRLTLVFQLELIIILSGKILIKTNEEDVFWQESKKTREYIKNNYIKEGTIEDFDIYRVSN